MDNAVIDDIRLAVMAARQFAPELLQQWPPKPEDWFTVKMALLAFCRPAWVQTLNSVLKNRGEGISLLVPDNCFEVLVYHMAVERLKRNAIVIP